ncbi:hypothetical protein AKG39_06490 [Acetobacterium bakii]|uniref:Type II secretion system protein GspF domain-containing protein n=2 Tax=Acetobacterium bakii TaxID=52689 RepID=A0A0L6U1S2_9FIRM|nr:hypothetical protein AKG39_06490 [Acetobacterium bakii]
MITMTVFVFLLVGTFLLFNISPFELTSQLMDLLIYDKKDIKTVIKKTVINDKKSPLQGIINTIREAQLILKATGRESVFATLVMVSTILFIVGIVMGLMMENIALSGVLGVGLSLFPFWYIKLTEVNYKKELNDELETTLSIIDSSYGRSKNIVKAVEENLYHINPPLSTVFESFVFEVSYVTADIPGAILRLSETIDNQVFREWCRALIACQDNPNLINTLSGIVYKLTDIKQNNDDMGIEMFEPVRTALTMICLVLGAPVLFYLINIEWFNALTQSFGGKIVLAIAAFVIFISINGAVKLTKPVEYSR